MIKKYYTGGPWQDVLGDSYNSTDTIELNDPYAKLSQPGDINLDNLYNNLNIKLKKPKGGMSGFIDNHPYLRDTVHGLVSGATMALNYQDQNRMKKVQRDYLNDPFNLYETSSMKKYGSYPWLTSTGQFTDFPNEKVPVYEPGYQNSAYTNPMATAKKGGQLYMAFQGGGSTDQLGQMGDLPKYEMGAGSPIQNAIKMDSSHYGIPTAQKGGGFFTPEKLTDNTENYEYYEKPNNFLNYLRDMSANAVIQKALGNKRKGQLSESEEMGFAQMGMQAPQQTSEQTSQEQLMQMVAQALQQGATPEEVDQKLIEMGIPEEQAMQIVDAVVQQLQGAGQEQAQQEMPEEMMQEMPMAQMGMGMSGSDFQEFGFDGQNPLNPYYTGMYDPNEAKQANSQLMQGLYSSAQDAFSKPIAKAKQTNAEFYQNMQKLQDMINKSQQPTTAKYGGIPRAQIGRPAKTTEADFETWYNTELGKLIASGDQTKINAFVNQARQTAYDYGYNPNQLGYTNLNTNTVAGGRDTKYDTELETLIADSEAEYDNAMLNNADAATLQAIEDKRAKAMDALNKKYPVSTNKITADYYGSPAKPTTPAAGGNSTNTSTNTNTNTGGGGAGGYQFNPAMQSLLQAMAAGYTKTPLFGFRTKRNINALFNQAMAQQMINMQGQGQGTAGAAGTTVPGAPVTGPGANAQYNTWFKDNNINRYDITQGPNRYKMRIRANQPGQGNVQYNNDGSLVTPNDQSFIDKARNRASRWDTIQGPTFNSSKINNVEAPIMTRQFNPAGYNAKNYRSDIRNDKATNRLTEIGNKLDRLAQKDMSLKTWYNDNQGISPREERQQERLENRYNRVANRFDRDEYIGPRSQSGGSYEMGGQYQQGGTYYLSDEEIQALINAGYELE